MNMKKACRVWMFTVALSALASNALAAGDKVAATLLPISSVTVHFDDLNTSTQAGVSVLYARVRGAASVVCRSGGGEWYPGMRWESETCYRATLDRVVARLNIATLTSLHLASTHRGTSPKRELQAGNR
jgi:UrcA family protein